MTGVVFLIRRLDQRSPHTTIRPGGAIVTNAQKTAALFRPTHGHDVDAIREAIKYMSTYVLLRFPFVCPAAMIA
jgi:hypothetical protein